MCLFIEGDVKKTGLNAFLNTETKDLVKQDTNIDSLTDDAEPEMDQITKELLNMKIGANGVILSDVSKSEKSSREAILPTSPQSDKFTPVAMMRNDTDRMNLSMDIADTSRLIKKLSPVNLLRPSVNDTTQHTDQSDLTSFYTSHGKNYGTKNFNKMQNDLLHEMFKMRTSSIDKKSFNNMKV